MLHHTRYGIIPMLFNTTKMYGWIAVSRVPLYPSTLHCTSRYILKWHKSSSSMVACLPEQSHSTPHGGSRCKIGFRDYNQY